MPGQVHLLAVQVTPLAAPQSLPLVQQPAPPFEPVPQTLVLALHVAFWQPLLTTLHCDVSPVVQQPACESADVTHEPLVQLALWHIDRPTVQSVQPEPHDVAEMATQALLQS